MKVTSEVKDSAMGKKDSRIVLFLRRLRGKINHLFEPEEVEVTFKVEGKQVKYTYTKVDHKQVA